MKRIPIAVALAAMLGITSNAFAEPYPSRPIRLILPTAPGGAFDFVLRVVAGRLSAAVGQQVIVDNRPGGDQTIGLDLAAKASADGHTLLAVGDSVTVLPSLFRKLSFDPQTSFAPIILMTTQPLVLAVNVAVPASNFKEFVALSKAKPGTLSFGTGGPEQRFAGELIKKLAAIDMVNVPYKGGGPAIMDLIAGQVPAVVMGSSPVIPHARAGKVRILAVTAGTRSAALPDIPTLAESGLSGFDVYQWFALFAPAKTPKDIVARMNTEMAKVLTQPAVRERVESAGLEPKTGSPQEVELLIRDGQARWSKLIKELGLKLD